MITQAASKTAPAASVALRTSSTAKQKIAYQRRVGKTADAYQPSQLQHSVPTSQSLLTASKNLIPLTKMLLKAAWSNKSDPRKLVDYFVTTSPALKLLCDKNADAISIGTMLDFGLGIIAASGLELIYIRPQKKLPGKLCVNTAGGGFGKFGSVAAARYSVRNFYGDSHTIANSIDWTGFETGVGPFCTSVMRLRNAQKENSAVGFSTTLSLGSAWAGVLAYFLGPWALSLFANIPGLSDCMPFYFKTQPHVSIVLTKSDVARIEAALAGSPDLRLHRSAANQYLHTGTTGAVKMVLRKAKHQIKSFWAKTQSALLS